MNPLRSVGARLGLALAVVVAGALVLVDLIVVPSLEKNLTNAKLTQLKEAAPAFARRSRRLEPVADRIGGGDFSEPVVDSGRDELGQLAAAFERMRQRLAQLDHARREFIANASHELRTPLFSLGGFLELMTDEQLDDETRVEFLATMREQVDRLTKLASELLDLSRLDAGHLSVEQEPVALARLAHTVADEFAAVARTGS